ncbi:MAG: restriction endonuclease subunit S [Anaerolineales bacterium]|nr:restriction endonuclease subunit S [Anaerolineales bacterium]
MKKGWEIKTLGEVCILRSGTTLPPSIEKPEGELPYLKVADMNIEENDIYVVTSSRFVNKSDVNENGIIPVGSTIFPKRGGAILTNKKRLTTIPICMDLNLMAVSPKQEITSEYLFYYFIGLDLRKINNGSSIPQINNYSIEPLQISYPPLPEQQRIVSVLDEAFVSIAQAKSNAERNLVNARELFESVLESFFEDPQHTPDGRVLESLCELIVDCEHKTAPIQEEGYPSIRTPNIGRGYFILDGVNRVSDETYKRWTRRAIPQVGDLIFAREAPAGNVAVIPKDLEPCLGQRTVLIRPNKKVFKPYYLMWLLLSDNVQKFFVHNSKGSTVVHVNMKDIRGLKINNIPPLDEQRAIVGRLEALSAETGRLEEIYQSKVESLEELKKSVLAKAFEGEL